MSVVGKSVGDSRPIEVFQPVGLASSEGNLATVLDQGLLVTQQEFINVMVTFSKSEIAVTSWAVLIDLSNTALWPHEPGSGLDISHLSMQVDKPVNARGRLQVGVITRVDGTSGDVSVFRGLIFDKDDGSGRVERFENFSPSQIRTEVVEGATPSILTGTRILADTALQTDVLLESPLGPATVFPGVGDIVIRFLHTSGSAWNGAVSALYHANPAAV